MPSRLLSRPSSRRACLALALLAAAGAAQAQAWPDKPFKLVIPFAAGGATDILGRLLATRLGDRLGQPVVVDNKPGAGTVVAAAAVAKSPADGYTLLLTSNTTLTLNPTLKPNLPYDPVKSFTPIGTVASMGLVLVANSATPYQSVKDLVAQAQARPGELAYGSFGTGTTVHFGAEMFKHAAGIQLMHVPFNGSAPSLNALMSGQVPVAMDTVVASSPLIKAGKIRALAVLSSQRSPLLPQVPTAAEAGYPGVVMESWFALLAPAGLPAGPHQKLQKALSEVLAQPDTRQKLADLGLTPTWGPPATVTAMMDQELPHMRALALRAHIQAE